VSHELKRDPDKLEILGGSGHQPERGNGSSAVRSEDNTPWNSAKVEIDHRCRMAKGTLLKEELPPERIGFALPKLGAQKKHFEGDESVLPSGRLLEDLQGQLDIDGSAVNARGLQRMIEGDGQDDRIGPPSIHRGFETDAEGVKRLRLFEIEAMKRDGQIRKPPFNAA
jgi:hypothetical protein